MTETRTGLDAWLSAFGTARAHELTRQAARVVSELSEPATSGIPRTVDIVRFVETVAADSALMVQGTYAPVAGLTNLQANYFQPGDWQSEAPGTGTETIKADRVLLIADVPAGGTGLADTILLTDRIRVDDPEFGLVDLAPLKVAPVRGTGLVRVEAKFSRDGVT